MIQVNKRLNNLCSLHLWFLIEQQILVGFEPVADGFLNESQVIAELTMRLSRKERKDYLRRAFYAHKSLDAMLVRIKRKCNAFEYNITAAERKEGVEADRLHELLRLLDSRLVNQRMKLKLAQEQIDLGMEMYEKLVDETITN